MKSSLRQRALVVAAASLLAAGMAGAQSTLLEPNNSAGTPLDTPPLLAPPSMGGTPSSTESSLSAFDKLDSERRGYVTRGDVNRLPGTINFDQADRNRDGRLDNDEFQRFWQDHASPTGQ